VLSENIADPYVNYPSFYLILTEINICKKSSLHHSNAKFHEDSLSFPGVIMSRQTDWQAGFATLTDAFLQHLVANASKTNNATNGYSKSVTSKTL
jgi:hypothetical protein